MEMCHVHKTGMEKHLNCLRTFCRVCGRSFMSQSNLMLTSKREVIYYLSGIDMKNEDPEIYPQRLCKNCLCALYAKERKFKDQPHRKPKMMMAVFKPHQPFGKCDVCSFTSSARIQANAVEADIYCKAAEKSGTGNMTGESLSSTSKEPNCSDTAEVSQAEAELRKLSFRNPGKFMEDFNPEKSVREMRKLKRRMCKEKVKRNQMYDERGLLLENSEDWCDCLEMNCPGCHFPCPRCSSPKCGVVCRSNRCWFYETVECEGTDRFMNWPAESSSKLS